MSDGITEMDWANRWFACKSCGHFIRTPKAFLNHKRNCDILNPASGLKTRNDLNKKSEPAKGKETLPKGDKLKKSQKPHKCEVCDYATINNSDLKRHTRTHTGERPFVCTVCNYSCKERGSLKTHRRCHEGETPFKCSSCGAGFVSERTLAHHIARQHKKLDFDEPEPFSRKTNGGSKQCRFCSKLFSKLSSRNFHERIHSGERTFVCGKCDASFVQKASLKQHLLTHEEVKPFKCHLCEYSTSTRRLLVNHNLSKHANSKHLKCPYCNFATATQETLRQHKEIHGPKKFKCQHCDYASYRRRTVKKHESVKHKMQFTVGISPC